MSTSYSAAAGAGPQPEPEVHPFPYVEAGGPAASAAAAGPGAPAFAPEDSRRREEAAREAGRQEGEARARASYDQQLQAMRESLRRALEEFARDRTKYYQQVEGEIVQLALSIARKILHREARVDPLLLAGLVRVALDQLQRNTKVVVRVHPQYAADCRDYFSRCRDAEDLPEVVEDPELEAGRTVLQTTLGSTEIGIEVQLKEIEQGLMDLLAQRPQAGR